MHPANDISLAANTITSPCEQNNLAQLLLNNQFFCWFFPVFAYIFAVLLQTKLNDLVGMQYGASILYLSFGVRFFVALLLGLQGLIWMLFGQVFIFAFYPTPYYNEHPVEGFLLSCSYSAIAFLAVEIVRKLKRLDTSFSTAHSTDILLITAIGSFIATLAHGAVFGSLFQDPAYSMITSFLAKLVGAMIGFYGLLFLFSLLYRIRLKK